MADDLTEMALRYHRLPQPGKLAIVATKPMETQRDLSLAYSPGVAKACELIAEDPSEAANMTSRGNLVAVISNGTAVLGLGNIGPLASKPVMEGKAVLFKKFAGIDVFDIEVAETDPHKLVDIVCALEPTFGGVNLEDIKAPECFIVEKLCRERMKIPVFHDDQHGTAICVGAAVYNALRLVEKDIAKARVVCSGAGAAAQACLDLLISMGVDRQNILMCDRKGVVYEGRDEKMDPYKGRFAVKTDKRDLMGAIEGADVFLGVSGPGTLTGEMVAKMAENPIILALANPTPEIMPEEAKAARPDAIIATGRSDYPNQVNNVLCFPFLFRGALDTGATVINEAMKVAAVKAIADLAMAEASDVVARAYGGEALSFGPEYLIPKPFDPRLITEVSSAVAQAAMDSGVATRPIEDMAAYRRKLTEYVYRSSFVMKPLFDRAREKPARVAYAEGEDERTLRALQIVVDEGLAEPWIVGRRRVVETRIERMGLRIRLGKDVHLVDPEDDERYREYSAAYHEIAARRGVSPAKARMAMRTDTTVIGSMMVHMGLVDAMICGLAGEAAGHIRTVRDIVGAEEGVRDLSGLQLLVLPNKALFVADTLVSIDPSAEELAEMAILAAETVRRFGIEPKVALVSHSNFGTSRAPSADKVRRATEILDSLSPNFQYEGEMQADAALSAAIREQAFPASRLEGAANVLIMPTLDAANIAFNMVKALGDGVSVGPIMVGMAKPAHVVAPSITVRGLVNMTAVAVVDAQDRVASGNVLAPLSSAAE
ncbi:NADP-dependent malic enzyme [Oceanibacterium hippocampi]|uniref:NADP-dependent malic enzyme n=1 Tax=Oceanibacterium hippocampi TaxID=745714 RepID=A0A1Y5SI29_9PROT|nr:NADP-dependent malic enzyme [Oceanibacterium hippocampi]SLN40627.1 NADP-dependent malic enzyme [Oceanibacterium hippocampi]